MIPRALPFAVAIAALVAVASRLAPPASLLINESPSLPRGLYLRTAQAPAPGRLVAVRPPPEARRYLASLGAPAEARLFKRVAAATGDPVCRIGLRLTWSGGARNALSHDRAGRPLPAWQGCRRLGAGELLVLGDTPDSFDSRYFGPVGAHAVAGVYKEVWTW